MEWTLARIWRDLGGGTLRLYDEFIGTVAEFTVRMPPFTRIDERGPYGRAEIRLLEEFVSPVASREIIGAEFLSRSGEQVLDVVAESREPVDAFYPYLILQRTRVTPSDLVGLRSVTISGLVGFDLDMSVVRYRRD